MKQIIEEGERMEIKTVGSICSGIEAASVAWKDFDFQFKWFSEIADFPSRLLAEKYPETPNLGDMTDLPEKILNKEIEAPDLLCGGTPCQAFSLAGWRNGLEDDRGNLTLSFVDIVEASDKVRLANSKNNSIVFWENVEGVLKDKTNAFGSFISALAGLDDVLEEKKWANAGVVRGPKRNVAWRVLDAKYFGVPQQRRRIYVLAGGKDFYPEDVLFEEVNGELGTFESYPLTFEKDGAKFEVFREYTDVLYSAYGTKWNGNAAAYNGSLFISQDGRLRRVSPIECERLMGFPDGYTDLEKAKRTNRYQALGNSWAVPVIKWIGSRIVNHSDKVSSHLEKIGVFETSAVFLMSGKKDNIFSDTINHTEIPGQVIQSSMFSVVDANPDKAIYISPVGCAGILRRKTERSLKINSRLEAILVSISSEMSPEEIEKRSRVQKRGDFSLNLELEKAKNGNEKENLTCKPEQMNLFDDFVLV